MKQLAAAQDQGTTSAAHHPPSARLALAALGLPVLMAALGTSIANVALPTLAQAFDASFQQVQWVVLAYLVTMTALIVGVGRLGDLVGRRQLLLAGIALFTAASLLCGLAPTLALLIAARALQGLAAAVLMALTMALVADAVPKAGIGRAMGLLGTMSAIGTALGPTLGGALIAGPGWRAIFLVNLPLGVLAFAIARHHLPVDRPAPQADHPGFDLAGTLLLALTLTAYALAMTTGRGGFGALTLALLLAAALGCGLFMLAESRAASPLISQALLRDPALKASLAMGALVSTVVMATLVVGPFHLARALGLDPAATGLALSVGPLVAVLAGVPAGRLTERLGAARTIAAGLLAMGAGCLALALVPTAFGVPGYLLPLATITAGYALFQAANNTAVMADVPQDRRGLVSGLANLSRNLGLVSGAAVMGAVFAHATATGIATATPAAIATGTRATFTVATLLIAAALAIAAAARLPRRRA